MPQAQESKEKVLFEWSSHERPYKAIDKKFYTTVLAIAFITGLVLFFVDGWAPVILIVALVFLFYVMSTIEPEKVQSKLTNQGIWFSTSFIPWEALGSFWFTKQMDNELLTCETFEFPWRLSIVIDSKDKDKIQEIVSKKLEYREIPPIGIDRIVSWIAKKTPQRDKTEEIR